MGCAIAILCTGSVQAAAPKVVVWEYRVVNAGMDNRQLEALLNSNGAAGWELVQINARGVAIFKRPKAR